MIQRCYACEEEFEVRRVEWRAGRWDLTVRPARACPFCAGADILMPPSPTKRQVPPPAGGDLSGEQLALPEVAL